MTIPQFIYPLYWRWMCGLFLVGHHYKWAARTSCPCQMSFKKSDIRITSLQDDYPPVIHNLFAWVICLFGICFLSHGMHGIDFFLTQIDSVWGCDTIGDTGSVPEQLWKDLGATELTSSWSLEMLLWVRLHRLPLSHQHSVESGFVLPTLSLSWTC